MSQPNDDETPDWRQRTPSSGRSQQSHPFHWPFRRTESPATPSKVHTRVSSGQGDGTERVPALALTNQQAVAQNASTPPFVRNTQPLSSPPTGVEVSPSIANFRSRSSHFIKMRPEVQESLNITEQGYVMSVGEIVAQIHPEHQTTLTFPHLPNGKQGALVIASPPQDIYGNQGPSPPTSSTMYRSNNWHYNREEALHDLLNHLITQRRSMVGQTPGQVVGSIIFKVDGTPSHQGDVPGITYTDLSGEDMFNTIRDMLFTSSQAPASLSQDTKMLITSLLLATHIAFPDYATDNLGIKLSRVINRTRPLSPFHYFRASCVLLPDNMLKEGEASPAPTEAIKNLRTVLSSATTRHLRAIHPLERESQEAQARFNQSQHRAALHMKVPRAASGAEEEVADTAEEQEKEQ